MLQTKRILPALVWGIMLAVMIVPVVTSAQEVGQVPDACCELRRNIDLGGGTTAGVNTFAAGSVVGEKEKVLCSSAGKNTTVGTPKVGIVCALNVLNTVIDWFFLVLIILAVFFTILGAFNYLTSGGVQEKLTNGKNYIMYAAIGVAVAFLARAIPAIVKGLL